jgi:CubicO group peptidase (beta-lactamase class C family)
MKMKRIIQQNCLILLCIALVSPLFATVDFPETPAGMRAKEITELLNGTSSLVLDDYIQNQYAAGFRDAFPIAAHKRFFEVTKTMFGKLHLVEIVKSTNTEFSGILKSDTKDAWVNMNLNVEANKPHLIALLGLQPGSKPENYNADKDEKNTINDKPEDEKSQFTDLSDLDKFLLKKTQENEFSGVVLVADKGNPLFHKAFGFASKRFDVLNKTDTKFNLGSCNKLFTTIAIIQLVEKGLLLLDDPIGKYLDVFPEEIASKVKIIHLLNMKSGWGDYWGNEYFLSHQNSLRKVSDYIEFIKDMPLDFEPGTNFQHSNTGFQVAGAILEKITGMDYYDYIQKNIYTIAGMKNSDSFQKDGPVKNLAVGYTNMNENDKNQIAYEWTNTYMIPPRGTPTGGGYSTTEDIQKLDIALRNNKLLSSKYTDFFFNRLKGNIGDPYIPEKMYAAMGMAPGIAAFIGIDKKTGYTIVILSNYDSFLVKKIADEIKKMYKIE